MKVNLWQRVAFLLSLVLITSVTAAQTREDIDTKWSDIKQWKSLGLRWAVGMDAGGNALAVYDLSYPGLGLPMKMGGLGGNSLGVKQIVALIVAAKSEDDADQKQLDDAATDVSHLNDNKYGKKVFPNEWWVKTPWKQEAAFNSTSEPERFRLSDINMNLATKKSQDMQEALAEVQTLWAQLIEDDETIKGEFLEQFELTKSEAGLFEMSWSPVAVMPVGYVSKPKKISDIKCPKCSFFADLKWKLFKDAVGRMIKAVNVPVVQAMLKVASERFFHFQKLQVRTHENMVLEMLNDLKEQGGAFPPSSLTPAEQFRSIESISYAQTSIMGAYKYIWQDPYDQWEKLIRKGEALSVKNADWFADNDVDAKFMSSRFAITQIENKERLHLMSLRKPNKKQGPLVAVDTLNPTKEARRRTVIEILTPAVIFSANFLSLPLVGSALEWLWGHFVSGPVDKARVYEGKLTAQLEQRASSENNWAQELAILDAQRVNPMMRSRASMMELIAKRRAKLGL